jgi:hypothetical protein
MLDWNTSVPVTLSGVRLKMSIWHAPNGQSQPLDGRPSDGRCVSWGRSPPRVLMEKTWQISAGFSPKELADARKNTRPRTTKERPKPVSPRPKLVSCTRSSPSLRNSSNTATPGTRIRVHGLPVGKVDQDGLRARARGELAHDASAWDQGGGRNVLGHAVAISLDPMTPEGRAAFGETAVEGDGPTVEKAGEPHGLIRRACHPRLVRQLGAPARAQMEQENLRRLVPGRVWAEVDERKCTRLTT